MTYSNIKTLVQATGVKIAIETGIGSGDTTKRFAELFDWVHTIDCDEDIVRNAGKRFSDNPHIRCYLGDSREVMDAVLPNLQGLVFLYLDAHGPTEPLGEEINVIAKHLKDRAIIVIDDFLVPGDDRFCGAYKYENIKSNLEGVYPGGYLFLSRIDCDKSGTSDRKTICSSGGSKAYGGNDCRKKWYLEIEL